MSTELFECPNCSATVTYGMDKCPNCGMEFSWEAETEEVNEVASETHKDTTNDVLLKGFYWFKLLNCFCPLIGVVLLLINKQYKDNLNRRKADIYDRLFKDTVLKIIIWVILIAVLGIYAAISMKKAKEGM